MCDQQSLRSACAYAQSDQSIRLSLEYSTSVKLLTEYHLEFLSLKGGCAGSSESTLVKMSIVGNLIRRLILYYVVVRDALVKSGLSASSSYMYTITMIRSTDCNVHEPWGT